VLTGIDTPGDAFKNRAAAAEGEIGYFKYWEHGEVGGRMTNGKDLVQSWKVANANTHAIIEGLFNVVKLRRNSHRFREPADFDTC
jgi:hypothetical protein